MITYLLDTDIIIYWMKNKYPKLSSKIKKIGFENIQISAINVAELYYGAYNSKKKKDNLKLLESFTNQINILQMTKSAAIKFGEIKSILKSEGNSLNDSDIFIASIAIVNNCTLVTNNTKHFKRIEGLIVENWT